MKILKYGDMESYIGKCPNCSTICTMEWSEVKEVKVLGLFRVQVAECPKCGALMHVRKRDEDWEDSVD